MEYFENLEINTYHCSTVLYVFFGQIQRNGHLFVIKQRFDMNALLSLGKYLYAIPFAIFGIFHFMGAEAMAGMVPIPGGVIWVYITGLALLAAVVSMLTGKKDKLATMLLGVLMLIFALAIHLPGALGGDQAATASLLKDLSLAGAAWMYAQHQAVDAS